MGFWDKIKSFGSKVVKGIRKGWDWVKEKVAPVVRKVLPLFLFCPWQIPQSGNYYPISGR